MVIGRRHNPLGMAFMNGTTQGKEAFILLIGLSVALNLLAKGWRMLVEVCRRAAVFHCLHWQRLLVTWRQRRQRLTVVRHQFAAIGQFEGAVQEALARIIANTYKRSCTSFNNHGYRSKKSNLRS